MGMRLPGVNAFSRDQEGWGLYDWQDLSEVCREVYLYMIKPAPVGKRNAGEDCPGNSYADS